MAKFYHYTLWIKNDEGKRLDPRSVLSDNAFRNDSYLIDEKDDKSYYTRGRLTWNGEYHGILLRGKDDAGFIRRSEGRGLSILADVVDGEGETGDLKSDYVNYCISLEPDRLDLLLEVGFQTPGIGVLTKYIRQNIEYEEAFSIEHETKLIDNGDMDLEAILDRELKSVEVSFKKNPTIYSELDVEESLKSLIPDDYRLNFKVSLHPGKEPEPTSTRDYLGHLFSKLGSDDSTVERSIAKIDFPRIMNTLRVVGLEGEQEVEDNLADLVKKEEIDTTQYGYFDQKLGHRLANLIQEAK